MRRPRTVEITNNKMTASVVINGLDISDMITGTDIHLDAESFPRVTIHSSPDLFSFTGAALVDDPRLPPVDVSDVCLALGPGFKIDRHEVDGIERLRRRLAEAVD